MKTQEEVVRQHAVGPISIYKIYQEGYQDRELDDWDAFRREAAKDMLTFTTQMKLVKEGAALRMVSKETAVKLAIEYADELIKQLKEK